MKILVVDKETRDRIKELKAYAEENPCTIDFLLDVKSGSEEPIGTNPKHNMLMEHGYRIVYSIDEYPNNKFQHISISHNNKKPSHTGLLMILEEFGFGELQGCQVYEEPNAINVVEKI